MYFSANDHVHGRELFAAEPGGGEIHLITDLAPGIQSSMPRGLKPYRGGVIFNATSPQTGSELWWAGWSSGTSYSVRLVKDIIPGPLGSNPEVVAVIGTVALFYATTPSDGRELWSTLGDVNMTAIVRDVFKGIGDSVPMSPCIATSGDLTYLIALTDVERGNCLWRYRADTNSLDFVLDVSENTHHMTILNKQFLYGQWDSEHGSRLWRVDEEATTAYSVAEFLPQDESSVPRELFTWRDQVVFQAGSKELGRELWRSDGTPQGTMLLKDIAIGPESSDPYGFVSGDSELFFSADDHLHGRELWFSDGTSEGTQMLSDIWPGPASGVPYNIVPGPPYVFFSANDGIHGEELWCASRETGDWEVKMIKDIYEGPQSSEPYGLRWPSHDFGVLSATAPDTGREPYLLYATSNHLEIRLFRDIYPQGP